MMFRWPSVCHVGFVVIVVASLSTPARWLAADVPDERVLEAERRRIATIDSARKTAISVFAPGGKGGGSGVVISPDGYALSNFHVVKPIGSYLKCGMADNRLYDAVVVGIDPTGDVALIKLLGRDDFPHAELGDSDAVRVGDWCFVIGNPFMLATDLQPTVSYGMVSGVNRYQPPAGTLLEYTDCIQTDAAINPGNSGGPLFNAQGELIGINGRGSFEKRGRVNVGVGYAISVNQIKKFMGYLRSGRIVDHATLGATVTSDEQGRVVVSEILQSSDAYRRGLRYGDRILSFGGREINSVNGFKNVLGIFPRGWRVPLSFRHEKERHDVWVRLAGVHSRQELIEKIEGPSVPLPHPKPKPKKRPDEPSPKPPEGPRKVPRPSARPATQKPPPKHVARMIEKRSGYANYHFNELHRNRVWSQFTEYSNCVDLPASWTLRGTMDNQAPFEITLGEKEVRGVFPSNRDVVDPRVDLDQQLLPLGSGGLLPALSLWQRLLTNGPEDYGEVYYLGTAPLIDHDGLFDVLVGIHNVVESRFAFDPDRGNLVAVEMFPETNVDPCELYFSDYREVNGCLLPHRILVRYGNTIFTELNVEEYEMGTDSSDPS
ncbi:MAG: trypsin-like peptidase domain-containing protein [Pirellulaceae bacterium]